MALSGNNSGQVLELCPSLLQIEQLLQPLFLFDEILSGYIIGQVLILWPGLLQWEHLLLSSRFACLCFSGNSRLQVLLLWPLLPQNVHWRKVRAELLASLSAAFSGLEIIHVRELCPAFLHKEHTRISTFLFILLLRLDFDIQFSVECKSEPHLIQGPAWLENKKGVYICFIINSIKNENYFFDCYFVNDVFKSLN